MRGAVVTLLCACVAVVRAIPMHHESMEEKDSSMMKMFEGKMGRHKRCHDPVPMFIEMFSLICDTKNCTVNAPMCVGAMMPTTMDNMCEIKKECYYEMRPTKNRKERPSKKMMMECVCEKMMTSMNLTYVKEDIKGNTLKMLEATMGKSKAIPDKTKVAVLNVVSDETCPAPTGDYMMMDKMKFGICILKTCVKSMAS